MQSALRTIRSAAGDDSTRQIGALRGLASAYQRLDMPNEATRALRQAWNINADSAAYDPLVGADIEVEIGDFHNAYGARGDARRAYTQAWQTLVSANAPQEVFDRYFASPVIISRLRMPDVHPNNSKTAELWLQDPDRFRTGTLQIDFDIDDYGRVKKTRVVEADPAGLLENRTIYLLGRYIYRPRMADGNPVATEAQRFSHTFYYLPDEEAPDSSSAAPAESGASEPLP
jgi:hypothetical protein